MSEIGPITIPIRVAEIPENHTAEAYQAAASVLATALEFEQPVAALSQDIQLHDIERYLPHPKRQAGTFGTASIDDFVQYISANAGADGSAGSTLLIDEDKLAAIAILDFGSRQLPGHKNLKAILTLETTSTLLAFKKLAEKTEVGQREFAEFIEGHFGNCEFYRESGDALGVIDTKAALKAIGSVDAERIKRSNSTVAPLSASASTFEQITISDATASLPTRMVFTCAWRYGLPEVSVSCRIRILADEESSKVGFCIDPIDMNAAKRQSAQDLQKILRERLQSEAVSIYLGSFQP